MSLICRFSQGQSEALVGTFKKRLFKVRFSEQVIAWMPKVVSGEHLNTRNLIGFNLHLSSRYSHVKLVTLVDRNMDVQYQIKHNRPFPSFSGLCIKTRVSAHPLIWNWFFILMQIKLISTRKVVRLIASFGKWGFLDLGSGLFLYALDFKHPLTRLSEGRTNERFCHNPNFLDP